MFQVQHWNIDEEYQILSISGMMFDIKMCKWHNDLYRNNYRGVEDIVHMTTRDCYGESKMVKRGKIYNYTNQISSKNIV